MKKKNKRRRFWKTTTILAVARRGVVRLWTSERTFFGSRRVRWKRRSVEAGAREARKRREKNARRFFTAKEGKKTRGEMKRAWSTRWFLSSSRKKKRSLRRDIDGRWVTRN
jgi:hypothetical protein